MLHDDITLKGRLDIVLTGPDGQIKDSKHVPNLVVTSGKEWVASRMAGTSSSTMSHMAIGTSSTSPAAGNTTLGSEQARVSLTSTTVSDNDVAFVATFAAGTPSSQQAIVEAGLFNAGTNGTMLCRTTFGTITKGSSDSLTITWTVTAS